MSIIRKEYLPSIAQFTIVPNSWVRDERLSRKAIGLLVQLMSHDDGWHTSIETLASVGKEGRASIRGAIQELEKFGYLVRRQERKPDGTGFGQTEYVITDPHAERQVEDTEKRVVRKSNDTSDQQESASAGEETVQETGEDDVVSDFLTSRHLTSHSLKAQNRPHKKTNTQEDQREEETPPNPPRGGAVARKRAPADRGTRLPDGWMPDRHVIDDMRDKCPNVDFRREHEVFSDYWRAKPGKDGRKSDWNATWRNWMRRAERDATRFHRSNATPIQPRITATDKAMRWMNTVEEADRLRGHG